MTSRLLVVVPGNRCGERRRNVRRLRRRLRLRGPRAGSQPHGCEQPGAANGVHLMSVIVVPLRAGQTRQTNPGRPHRGRPGAGIYCGAMKRLILVIGLCATWAVATAPGGAERVVAQQPVAPPTTAPSRSALATRSTSISCRCATACGCSRRSTCPRTTVEAVAVPADAHALQRRPVRRRRATASRSARPAASRTRASSSSSRTCAAATCRRASSSDAAARAGRSTGRRTSTRARDTYDTIDWLLKHVPNHNGRVGMSGISYPGFLRRGQADRRAPGAARPRHRRRPIADCYLGDDLYHNGAFMLAANFGFYSNFRPRGERRRRRSRACRFDYGTPDGYEFFLGLGPLATVNARLLEGKAAYFAGRSSTTRPTTTSGRCASLWKHASKGITPAVLNVGGWFDAEDLGRAAATCIARSSRTAPTDNRLVMGPWSHGGWSRGPGDRSATSTSAPRPASSSASRSSSRCSCTT